MAKKNKDWRKNRQNNPILTVDGLILDDKGQILLLKRNHYPFIGFWVVPGGGVEGRETTERAVVREVLEETGLKTKVVRLIGVYSGPSQRDPRYPSVAIAYQLKVLGGKVRIDWESKEIRWFSLNKLPGKIGFDHRKMILDLQKLIEKR